MVDKVQWYEATNKKSSEVVISMKIPRANFGLEVDMEKYELISFAL